MPMMEDWDKCDTGVNTLPGVYSPLLSVEPSGKVAISLVNNLVCPLAQAAS